MDVERAYLRYQDFGMALAATIVMLLVSSLLRVILAANENAAVMANVSAVLAWAYSVYLNFDGVRTQKLDSHAQKRPLRNRILVGSGIFLAQILAGVTYAMKCF